MPSTTEIERPQEVLPVVRRYLSRERPLSALFAGFVVSLILGTYLATSLLPAVVVAAILVAIVRAPIVQPYGTVRLRTDEDPQTVVDAFSGPTPPVLALQWGIADDLTTGEGTVTYRTSYLFGLRAVEMTVRRRTEATPNGTHRVTLVITEDDQPWATYTATMGSDAGQTAIEVEHTSNRRFGLQRLPQRVVANRYRDAALAALGYTVVSRDGHLSV